MNVGRGLDGPRVFLQVEQVKCELRLLQFGQDTEHASPQRLCRITFQDRFPELPYVALAFEIHEYLRVVINQGIFECVRERLNWGGLFAQLDSQRELICDTYGEEVIVHLYLFLRRRIHQVIEELLLREPLLEVRIPRGLSLPTSRSHGHP